MDRKFEQMLDYRSDTVTHPTEEMREAMRHAQVGDDVYQDDPTTNRLEALAAEMLGKESALFTPSGTMSNQLALMTHTSKGDEAIVSAISHIFEHEVGAAAILASLNLRPLHFPQGIYNAEQIAAAIRPDDIHEPPTTLICLENSIANGRVLPVENMRQIQALAKQHGIAMHLDGARLFNAATALEVDAKEIAACVDTVSCCLSKGLCSPVGSLLAGPASFIKKARKYRKMLGGGMRQTGILAAAGIISLTKMTKRLGEDHATACALADELAQIPGVTVDVAAVQTNMVFAQFVWPHLDKLPGWLHEHGIIIGQPAGSVIRFVTHYGIAMEDVGELAGLLREFGAEQVLIK